MSLRLRGHHLLCLLTYRGEGYSPAFIAGFESVIKRLTEGEEIELIEGPDDICTALLDEDACAHCILPRVVARDRVALHQIAEEALGLQRGNKIGLTGVHLAKLRQAFAGGRIRAACTGCEWNGLCTQISANNFAATRLKL